MKTFCIHLLMFAFASSLLACEKADYEEKAEKAASARAERNRADHEKRKD